MRTNPPDATPVFGNLFIGSAPEGPLDELCPWEAIVFAAAEYQPMFEDHEAKLLIYAPLRDGRLSRQDEAVVLRVAKELAHILMRGGRVLVTCASGLNRSALFAAATIVELGLAPSDAINEIRRARGKGALSNPYFVTFLENLGAPRRNAHKGRRLTADEYLSSPDKTCMRCGEPKPDVRMRQDPFEVEGLPGARHREHYVVCDDCDEERREEV